MFERLNAMSETVGKPTERPTSRIGQNNQKQIGVLYGHEDGGKVYTYLGSENLRVGDIVTPQVTHRKSNKTYNTLARVVSTRDSMGSPAQDTAAHLSGQGIMMKTIGPTNQQALPGFKEQKATNPKFTAKKWAQDAKAEYQQSTMKRLNHLGSTLS